MSVLVDQITLGDLKILVLDADPTQGAGYSAVVGSLAVVQGQSGIYQKANVGDLDWIISSVNSEDVQDIVGQMFTDSVDSDFQYDDLGNTASIVLTPTGVTAGSYGSATAVGTFTVDLKGRLTFAGNTAIAIPSTQVTDFVEAAQDAIGNILTDTATVNFTYDDGLNIITADVIQSGITHANLSGLSADDHAQYALLAGRAGSQSLNGGSAASENLNLSSTSNATKGKINLGANSAYDEANSRLGIGSNSPETIVHVESNNVKFNISQNSTTTSGAVNAVVASVTTSSNSVELLKVFVTGLRTNGSNESVAYERTVRVKNNGGTVSVPTIQSDYTSEDPSLANANCTFIVNGSAVDVRVTGVSGADILWKTTVQRMR